MDSIANTRSKITVKPYFTDEAKKMMEQAELLLKNLQQNAASLVALGFKIDFKIDEGTYWDGITAACATK